MSKSRHLMELPSVVLVGHDVLETAGQLLVEHGLSGPVVVASGPHVWRVHGEALRKALKATGLPSSWVKVETPDVRAVEEVERAVATKGARMVIGMGGGKSIDVAKLASYNRRVALVSIPTSASHDGMASPFASIRGHAKPYSAVTKPPFAIVADIGVIMKAPPRLFNGGVGDLLAKLTAVRDWQLARDEKGEYYGKYSANLARMSGQMALEEAANIGERNEEGIRCLVEALISAGVAAGIAGSSRPCSGAEHLFSHALDRMAPGKGLHGEKTGMGAIMMAKLHGLDWEKLRDALEQAKAPTKAAQIGLTEREVVRALVDAPRVRPDRYTILHKLRLTAKQAEELAKQTGVV